MEGECIPERIHIRTRQRNGRKSWTYVEGLDIPTDPHHIKRILYSFCRTFNCRVTLVDGGVLQLQGDKRDAVFDHLIKNRYVRREDIVRHGF